MKRTQALMEIRQCGYHGKMEEAALIQVKRNIGSAATRKAFMDGKKAKASGEICDCPDCIKARGGKK